MSRAAETDHAGEILFLVGAPRSGTTLLTRLLFDYFDYGMGPEGHWIVPLADRASSFGDLEVDENLYRLIDEILSTSMFEIVHEQYSERYDRRIEVTRDDVFARTMTRSYAGVAFASLKCLSEQLGRTRVGSKDPGFYRSLGSLRRLFPNEAKYLCIVRDGRDVALSMMKQPWGQKTWFANARLWAATYGAIEEFRSEVAPDRFFRLAYEDLLREPAATCEALEQFLDQPLRPERRAEFVADLSGGRSQNFDKWKSRMTPRDHRLYESIAGPWLDRFGYARTAPGARHSVFERVLYDGQEGVRRAFRKLQLTLGRTLDDVPTRTAGDTTPVSNSESKA